VAKLTASNGGGGDFFGASVATSGAIALVGAPRSSEVPGRSYVFNLDPIPGDLDCDGNVAAADLLALLSTWGPCDDCQECAADLNGDCIVGALDLLILLANWGLDS
ncbi:MAG: FG-GAP repeat protein, partial [Phycisphaerales bacterium]